MRIVIDLTSLSYHITGIERYALNVSLELLKKNQTDEFILIFRDQIHPYFDIFSKKGHRLIVLKGNNKFFFSQFILLRCLNKLHADFYLFFALPSPLFFFKKNQINAIHDMGAWDCGSSMKFISRLYFKTLYRKAAKLSKYIFTVSNFSKERIHSILKFDTERIKVLYPGIAEHFNEKGIASLSIKLPEKYILSLSTLEPRKNFDLLLRAFSNIHKDVNYKLVIVGRKGWKIDELIKKFKLSDFVIFTGFIEDCFLPEIYKNAKSFVFPSKYEGFGLPPIEALYFGCPVISSNSSCLPEILRGQALYFENNNQKELENILLSLENCKMDNKLDEFQKVNYDFSCTATKIRELLRLD